MQGVEGGLADHSKGVGQVNLANHRLRYRAKGKKAGKEQTTKPNLQRMRRHRMRHHELPQCNQVVGSSHIEAMHKSTAAVPMKRSGVRRRVAGSRVVVSIWSLAPSARFDAARDCIFAAIDAQDLANDNRSSAPIPPAA